VTTDLSWPVHSDRRKSWTSGLVNHHATVNAATLDRERRRLAAPEAKVDREHEGMPS